MSIPDDILGYTLSEVPNLTPKKIICHIRKGGLPFNSMCVFHVLTFISNARKFMILVFFGFCG